VSLQEVPQAPRGQADSFGNIAPQVTPETVVIPERTARPHEGPEHPGAYGDTRGVQMDTGGERVRAAVEQRAQEAEAKSFILPPSPLGPPPALQMPRADELRAVAGAKEPFPLLTGIKPEETSFYGLLRENMTNRNYLVNTWEQAFTDLFNETRNRIDPDFWVPSEQLKDYDKQYHEFLMEANNAEDLAFRQYEAKQRMKSEEYAAAYAKENYGLSWVNWGLTSVPTFVYYAGLGSAAAGGAGLVAGASYGSRLAALAAAEGAMFAPEAYFNRRAGTATDFDNMVGLGLGFLGVAWGARFLRSARTERAIAEAMKAEEAAVAKEIWRQQAGLPSRLRDETDFEYAQRVRQLGYDRMARGADERKAFAEADEAGEVAEKEYWALKARRIIDEEHSIEVLRDRDYDKALESIETFEADQGVFEGWWQSLAAGETVSRATRSAIDQAFERHRHVFAKYDSQGILRPKDASVFIAVPAKMSKNPEKYLRDLLKKGHLQVGYRNADDVLGGSPGTVLRVRLPKGTQVLDMQKFGKGPRGSLAFRFSDGASIAGAAVRAGADDVLKLAVGTAGKLKTLTRGGKKLTQNGQPLKYTEIEVSLPKPPSKAKPGQMKFQQQWVRAEADGRPVEAKLLSQTNAAKAANPNADRIAGLFDDSDVGPGAPLRSGGAAAVDAPETPVARQRVNDPDADLAKVRERFHEFQAPKTPWWTKVKHLPFGMYLVPTAMRAMDNPNPVFREVMMAFTDPGFNPTASELTAGKGYRIPMDRLKTALEQSLDAQIQASAVSGFTKYKKALAKNGRALPNAFQRKAIIQFNRDVDEYMRSKRHTLTPKQYPPGVKEHAEGLSQLYKDVLAFAKDPGAIVGQSGKFAPLEGFKDLDEADFWSPRVWMKDQIDEIDAMGPVDEFGDATFTQLLHQGLAKSMKLQNDENFLRWAARKHGIKDSTPRDLWSPEMVGKVEAEVEDAYRRIARAMAGKLRASKSGWSLDADLLIGNLATHRAVGKIVALLGDDYNPEAKKVIENILWKNSDWEWDEATGKRVPKKSREGKSGRHSFHRALLDENAFIKVPDGNGGTRQLHLWEALQRDSTQLARGYVRRMAGRIAAGAVEIHAPDGTALVGKLNEDGLKVGLNSDDAWRSLEELIGKVDQDIGPNKMEKYDGRAFGSGRNEIKAELDALWEHMTGNTPPGAAGWGVMQNLSYAAYMGNAGLAQAQEMANVIGMGAYKHLISTEPFTNLKKRLQDSAKMSQEERRQALEGLEAIVYGEQGFGHDFLRGALGGQMDERMGETMGAVAHTAHNAARAVLVSSGLTHLQQSMQRTLSMGLFHKYTDDALKFGSWDQAPRRHKQRLVKMSGSEGMARRVHELLRKHTVTEDRMLTKVVLDFKTEAPDFDQEAFFALKQGIARLTEQGVQTNSYGTMHRAFNSPQVRAFLTLKSFLYGSITKQLIKNFRDVGTFAKQGAQDLSQGDLRLAGDSAISLSEPVANILLQFAAGAASWMAVKEVAMLGLSSEEVSRKREELYTEMNLVQAGVSRAGALGLIPTVWNTPMQYINRDLTFGMQGYSSSGLAKTALSVPLTSVMTNWLSVGSEGATWALDGFEDPLTQKGMTRAQRLVTNQQVVAALVNVIGAQLLELEPE
jgi:hypothetical protein